MSVPRTVYLAGPISGCGPRQQMEWRESITRELKKADARITVIDPTDRKGKQRTEFKDLDKSHVIIAHLWRESIGTVIGMIRASRMGKPVIVIDPHYIYEEHSTLKTMVGAERVNDITAAVHKIKNEIFPRLDKTMLVWKTMKEGEPETEEFDPKKLRRAVMHACTSADIDDDYWVHIIPREVETALRSRHSSTVAAAEIKDEVFRQLDQLANESDERYPQLFKEQARRLKEKWNKQKTLKHPDRTLDEWADELNKCKQERERLGALVRQRSSVKNPAEGEEHISLIPRTDEETEGSPAALIGQLLGNQRAVCVFGKVRFSSAFARHHLEHADFARHFDEKPEEQGSNLNKYIAERLKSGKYVLYASDGLKYLDSSNRKAKNLVFGARTEDVVERFLERARKRGAPS